MDGQARLVGRVEALPEVFELEIARRPHVQTELLFGLELMEEVLGLADGRVQVAGLEGPGDIAGDARHLEPGLVVGLFRAGTGVDENRPVFQAMSFLIVALVHAAALVFVNDLCIS